MPFNLFHKKKQPEQQTLAPTAKEQTEQQATPAPQPEAPVEAAPAVAPEAQPEPEPSVPVEEAKQEPAPESAPAAEEQTQEAKKQEETPAAAPEQASKTYLKAMPLKDLSDVENVKNEVRNGNIIILRITPLAGKSIEDVKTAVNDLFAFAESIQGDIARLGEERVVICPKTIRIWREKTPAPVRDNQPLPTAA
jgi:Uncharacterized conserved protein